MKIKRLLLSAYCVLVLLVSIALPVLAATRAAMVVDDELDQYTGSNLQTARSVFYAYDKHWVFWSEYSDMEDLVGETMYSVGSSSGEIHSHIVVNNSGNHNYELAIWYDRTNNRIHYARVGIQSGPGMVDQILYRMGTPHADGTITWAAAEQVVANTLDTGIVPIEHCVAIACDGFGNPWVAWIDDDGINDYGIAYVESSSTQNGTWTESIATNFDETDQDAQYIAITPLETGLNVEMMEVSYSIEEADELDPNFGEVALWTQIYDNTGAGSWAGEYIADFDVMNATRTDAFCLYHSFGSVHCVYTGDDGAVYYRNRDSDTPDTWLESAAASEIKEAGPTLRIPTISGYVAHVPADDLLVIVHDDIALLYSIYDNVADDWGDWEVVWQVPNVGTDTVAYHTAAYQYNSPVGFAWLYEPDAPAFGDSILHYWWIDNENDELGYYQAGFWIINIIAPIFGVITALFILFAMMVWENKLVAMIGGFAGLIFTILAIVMANVI